MSDPLAMLQQWLGAPPHRWVMISRLEHMTGYSCCLNQLNPNGAVMRAAMVDPDLGGAISLALRTYGDDFDISEAVNR